MTIVVPGKFGSPTKRAREQMSNHLAVLLQPYLEQLGWDTVSNDVLSIAAGLIATGSDKPAKDLEIAAAFIRKYNWKRAKKFLFAARQGVNPDDLSEEFLKDAVPGYDQGGSDVPEGDVEEEAADLATVPGSTIAESESDRGIDSILYGTGVAGVTWER